MTIFKHKKSGVLYTIALRSPMMYTGEWFEATPLHGGKVKKSIKLTDYLVVATR